MHPILANRRLALYLSLFLPAGVLLGELLVRTAGTPRLVAMLLAIPLLSVYSFTCLASWYLCRSLPIDAARPERLIVNLSAAGLMAGGLLTAIGVAWARVLDGVGGFEGTIDFYSDSTTLVFVFAFLVFSLAVAVHYLFIASEASRAAVAQAYELRILAQEAELKALKTQIDPHFLFNSLNAISGLVVADPEQARRMCVALAEFLRQSLRAGSRESLPLAEELNLARSYLAVEQIRFGDRLRVEESTGEGCERCQVPPLILQPLIENAVRHGIAHLLEGGTVAIRIRRRGGRLSLEVENPCDGSPGAAWVEGIGLANVRQRLEAGFGRDAGLAVKAGDHRFRVSVTLPARETVDAGGVRS